MKTHKPQNLNRFGREFPDVAIVKKIKALHLGSKKIIRAKKHQPMITLEQAKRAEQWHLKNRMTVNDLVVPVMKDGDSKPPKNPNSPELWTGDEWHWYLFELAIS